MLLELADISDKVPYTYVNHVRLASNKWDVRLAFGDIGPTGKLEPRIGVILPHIVAKGLMRALGRIVENIESKHGEIRDLDEPSKVTTPENKSPSKPKKKRRSKPQSA
jgi:hypothetical protein